MSFKRVIAITGCDSGLGWAIAARSAREGLITIAGMYNGTDTEAAIALKNLCAHPYKLDVTNNDSVLGFKNHVITLLKDNPNYKLHALVNNAGVMIVGDYEWQTWQMIEHTLNVNLHGPMRMVSAFLPDLRKRATELKSQEVSKPRIINITSHCGLQPLPGFGPYSTSKAGLIAFTEALRLENLEFGLQAISFVPGGFVGSSKIMSQHVADGEAMIKNLNEEQKTLYEKKINNLINYLRMDSATITFDSLKDETIIETFMQALTDEKPKNLYKVEPWRYTFYYNLFKLPFNESTKGWLINKFLNFPSE